MKRVVLLDYGSGNLHSAERALARVGADVIVTADADQAIDADGLVVPGVGAFAACMAGLHEADAESIIAARLAQQRPILGICVGMQVMFTRGVEHGIESDGLAVLPGSVERLNAPVLPHMGWNTVNAPPNSLLFKGLSADTRFYFVHSYAARDLAALPSDCIVTTAEHGEVFAAAVERGVISATQFHPEKSADAGAEVLANWLSVL